MTPETAASIVSETAPAALSRYYPLILLVGAPGCGKSEALTAIAAARGWPLVELGLELSTRLLECPKRRLPIEAREAVEEIVAARAGEFIILDHCEMLFSPELQVDPLRLLQAISRRSPLICAWTGRWNGFRLTYARPDHLEYRTFDKPDAVVVPFELTTFSSSSSSGPDSPAFQEDAP